MKHSERDLIVPALSVMRDHPEDVDTSVLIDKLTEMLIPTGHDAEIVEGRSDTYFSQKVRNPKTHNTLENLGLALYDNGVWTITSKGTDYLEEADPIYQSLFAQGMIPGRVGKNLKEDIRDIIIEEGAMDGRTVQQRKRSSLLRESGIERFKARHGTVFWEACGFNFENVYGEGGRDFIENHHKEAVHTIEVEGTSARLDEALEKTSLLCSNCHRMVHREKNDMLSMGEPKRILEKTTS